jgi:hypothetical protein
MKCGFGHEHTFKFVVYFFLNNVWCRGAVMRFESPSRHKHKGCAPVQMQQMRFGYQSEFPHTQISNYPFAELTLWEAVPRT